MAFWWCGDWKISHRRDACRAATDPWLIARAAQQDDRDAFAELVARHQSAVRALLRRLCAGDAALADDLAQETFWQAHRALSGFRGEARFATWLYRIAYNQFLADARRREPLWADDDADPDAVPDPASPLATQMAMKLDLEAALARLPVPQRAAIVQCYYHDLSHEEAAFVLDCPVGTVKTNVRRGRERLRLLLADWATV